MKTRKSASPNILWRRLLHSAFAAVVAIGILSAATSATAECGDPIGRKAGIAPQLPFLAQAGNESAQPGGNNTIVGLWHVTYTQSDGTPFYEAFDQWHSDRTEFENANLPPATGNVCEGVWKPIGPQGVRLHHIGWDFNADGSSAGTFTLDETNTLARDGSSYRGDFDYKAYDVNGNLMAEITGTQTATRIAVD
jgi:hypothetical protein